LGSSVSTRHNEKRTIYELRISVDQSSGQVATSRLTDYYVIPIGANLIHEALNNLEYLIVAENAICHLASTVARQVRVDPHPPRTLLK
jgi:hypothetical protein